jgi:hypothetical protein
MKQLLLKLNTLLGDSDLSAEEKEALQNFIASITPATGFLKLLSKGHIAKAADGKYSRKEFAKVFTGFLDSDIENWKCSDNDEATGDTPFDRHQLVKDGTFAQIFAEAGTFVENDDKLFFTKAQVKSILENNPELFFKDGRGHFFFYKNKKGDRFVLNVNFFGSEWLLGVRKLANTDVWYAGREHMIFVPQQTV